MSASVKGTRTQLLGLPHLHLRRTSSTNDRARELAIAGAPHGTLVSASEQTAGRGRQGRRWSAPAGSSLLISLVLRDVPTPLPLLAAVAVCDIAGEHARVKWPNDIVVEDAQGLKKLAGILVESRPQDGWAVLGIGINVATRPEQLPPELQQTAASLGLGPAAIEPMLHELLSALAFRLAQPVASTLEEWRARDALRGREIAWSSTGADRPDRVERQQRQRRGRGRGIDAEGRLLVELHDGQQLSLHAGEVHLHVTRTRQRRSR